MKSSYFKLPRRLIRQATVIALMAMVMLASAPTVSRMIAHYSGAQTLIQLCTSHGIMWVSVNPADAPMESDPAKPSKSSPSTVIAKTCGYCSPHLSAVDLVSPTLTSAPAYTILAKLPELHPAKISTATLRLPLQARAPPASLFI